MEGYELLIVGAGAAGISAAKSAYEAGCTSILLVEHKQTFGGILLQCLHRGFGGELNGPEYIQKLTEDFPSDIDCLFNTSVISVSPKKQALLWNALSGEKQIQFQQIILATGSMEIPIGALPVIGTRPNGIYTGGQMQEMMNLYGELPEGPVAILGSGDIGLIMAKHLYDANVPVTAIIEQEDRCGGMLRNQKSLEKTKIPLLLHTTIIEVFGYPYLEGLVLSDGTQLNCKTLLIAVGLRPDQTLIEHLNYPDWLHLCGNCRTISPIIDMVVREGQQAGLTAASIIDNRTLKG